MNPEQQNESKASDLKFSDFTSSGMKFSHDKGNPWEAMGIEEEEFNDLSRKMLTIAKDAGSISKGIENTLNADVPTKWKIVALLKIGEAMGASKAFARLKDMPDGLPGEIVKAMAILAVIGG